MSLTGEEEVPRLKPVEELVPPIKIEWEDAEDKRQGIVLNKQKELEERNALITNLQETTRMMNVSENLSVPRLYKLSSPD